MSINITIDADDATELMHNLQVLQEALGTRDEVAASAPQPVPETSEPAPVEAGEPEPEPEPASKPEPAPDVSKEDVRTKLAALMQAGKQDEVKALLDSFDVSKLSDVPAGKYGELMQAAQEIA